MNRGVFQSSSVQQVMGGSPRWWNSSDMRPPSSSSTSSSIFHQYPQASCFLPPMSPWQDNQEFPESWSQLLLGGLVGEEKCSLNPFQAKKMENWEDHLVYSISTPSMASLKQENSEGGCVYSDEIHAAPARSPWSQMLAVSSPRSCVTTSFSSNNNMLDFSSSKAEKRPAQPDHSSECNSPATGATFKKARVQTSSAQSTFKVRKEKLGDRITALHQLVSPFGKTDTASVLLEAIGYIRFLQGQIEALSSPYLRNGSANRKQSAQGGRNFIFSEDPCQQFESSEQLSNDNIIKNKEPNDEEVHEEPKDLRSRGLCLVPISCMLHVGSDNGADYWAPSFGGGFR